MQLKLGLFCSALHPWPSSTEKYPHLGNFPWACTSYEAMIFRGLCWRELTTEEGILAWGSKDQEEIEFRELAWKWSWLMLTCQYLDGTIAVVFLRTLWSWRGDGVEAEHLFCFLQPLLLPLGLNTSQASEVVQAQVGGGEIQVRGSHSAQVSASFWEEHPGWCLKIWTLFLPFYPNLSSMLLSSDICIVVKAAILLNKIKCFFSYVPSLLFIFFFLHSNC